MIRPPRAGGMQRRALSRAAVEALGAALRDKLRQVADLEETRDRLRVRLAVVSLMLRWAPGAGRGRGAARGACGGAPRVRRRAARGGRRRLGPARPLPRPLAPAAPPAPRVVRERARHARRLAAAHGAAAGPAAAAAAAALARIAAGEEAEAARLQELLGAAGTAEADAAATAWELTRDLPHLAPGLEITGLAECAVGLGESRAGRAHPPGAHPRRRGWAAAPPRGTGHARAPGAASSAGPARAGARAHPPGARTSPPPRKT
jgi:hypothetical protein